MVTDDRKKKILVFLSKQNLAVVSTFDKDSNRPESATMAFAETDDLELVFGTSNKTRKYKNLMNNPNVAFVVGFDGSAGYLQYEGVAQELSKDRTARYSKLLIARNPKSGEFIAMEDQRYFLVRPTWIRFLDTEDPSGTPTEVVF